VPEDKKLRRGNGLSRSVNAVWGGKFAVML